MESSQKPLARYSAHRLLPSLSVHAVEERPVFVAGATAALAVGATRDDGSDVNPNRANKLGVPVGAALGQSEGRSSV